ncbi:hypothetical protein Tco_0059075 [Tanacetum coccineum]
MEWGDVNQGNICSGYQASISTVSNKMMHSGYLRGTYRDDIGNRFPVHSRLFASQLLNPSLRAKVPTFVTLVAPLCARAIVVKMALGAFGQRSPIRLPFACPHIVDLGDILPLEGLLLVTMVVSG